MSSLIFAPPPPQLIPLDAGAGLSAIQFQFQPIGFTENISGNWASGTGFNRAHPIIQYSHGEQESFTFEVRLFARDSFSDVSTQLDQLRNAARRDDKLKRPPLWGFVWGSIIHETVVVQSVGNVRYDDIRPDGTIRGAVLQITLLIYRPVQVELTGLPPSRTFYATTKDGDQWEDIALREYDDPVLGDLLRRANPTILFPGKVPGTIVALPPLKTLKDEVVEPDSPPLRRTAEGLALRSMMYGLRSVSRESTIVLRS